MDCATKVLPGCAALLVLAAGASAASVEVRGEIFVSGLSNPVAMVQDPVDPDVQYVVQQSGRIRVIDGGVLQGTDFLNITGTIGTVTNERGLLGLAFAPDYAASRRFYINHTEWFTLGPNPPRRTVIARFLRSVGNPLQADSTSRQNILLINQDFENHPGGTIAFGTDGLLYIGMGDGGSFGDPNNRAQNKDALLGKMLRIDPDTPLDTDTYTVPGDNPFVGAGGALAGTETEIWAFGTRNPWKWSFDDYGCGATGAMLMADVGQDTWEEINYEPAGDGGNNYGWRHREGNHNYDTSVPAVLTPFTPAVHEYSHAQGESITGGYVYRGDAHWQNRGRYFFADFTDGRLWSIDVTGGVATDLRDIHDEVFLDSGLSDGGIAGFGRDASGELYIINYGFGQIIKVIPLYEPGDVNGDGAVDTADLGLLLEDFGTTANESDLNGDCVVDTADLGVLITNFD